MPGYNRNPIRPHHTWTFSQDRLGLSNGAGIAGFAFGALFTTTGLLALYAAMFSAGMFLGIIQPQADDIVRDQAWWRSTLGVAAVALIGIGHLAGGSLLLMTLRCKLDRVQRHVTVRRGWLGLCKTNAAFSGFDCVAVFPATCWLHRLSGVPTFDIALVGRDDARLVIGFATRFPDLAREVALEVSRFTGLQLA